MISGVLVGYLLVVGVPCLLVSLFVVGLARAAGRQRPKRFEAHRDAMAAMVNKAVDGSTFREPTHSMLLEPWTPAEREAFGINDTERWIRETDKALATPLERRGVPEPILRSRPSDLEEELGFREVRPGVWEQL